MKFPLQFTKKVLWLSILSMGMIFRTLAQENSPAHLGLVYPISTHGTRAAAYTNNLSIHALSGLSAGERGLAIYGLAGIIQGDATGLQTAGLWLNIEADLKGLQLSGLVNQAQNAPQGVQISGLANLLEGQTPVQLSGIINRAEKISAVQITGIVNISEQVEGLQLSGITNISAKIKGLQLGGIVNVAKDVKGSQIAGIFNKAETVSGIQLSGIINIADSSDYPIGLINIIKNGERSIGLSVDENLSSLISFRSGGRKLYGIIGLGSNFQDKDYPYAFEGGMGIKLLDESKFNLDLEASSLVLTDFQHSEYFRSGLRLLPQLKLSNNLRIFAGPSLNYMYSKNDEGSGFSKMEIWENQSHWGHHSVHVGFTGGIQIKVSP